MNKYICQSHVASPIYYPADVKYGVVYYGEKDSRFPIMDTCLRDGIAELSGSVALNDKDINYYCK
ncbi:MAG: hypothetical protein ACRCR9_00790 [Chitinophagaceae bacterium]